MLPPSSGYPVYKTRLYETNSVRHVTYICPIHCKYYMVWRTSVILYIKQDHMKQIEYDKHVTYICAIRCKCYMVSRTSVMDHVIQWSDIRICQCLSTLPPTGEGQLASATRRLLLLVTSISHHPTPSFDDSSTDVIG